MVGYVQDDYQNTKKNSESMKNFKASCFFGQQVKHYDIETTKPIEEGEKKLKFNKITKHNAAASQDLAVTNKPAAAAPAATKKAEKVPAATTQTQIEEETTTAVEIEK